MSKTLLVKIVGTLLLVGTLLCGCGYHTVAMRGPLAEANGVNVVLFSNKTYRPGLEGVLGRELIDELALRTGGKVLPREQAQLELTGTILTYVIVPVAYTALDTIKEYRTTVTAQAVLRERQTQKVLWKGDLIEDQTFPVYSNLAFQQNAEEAAAAKICRRLSEDIWRKISETF